MTAQGKRINGSVPPLPSPHTLRSVVWDTAPDLVPYPDALAVMDEQVDAIRAACAPEMVWLLEHPPLYTAGTSAKPADLLSPTFPVFESGRGGQFTYHGPGQRVAYVMLDLKARTPDVRWYVHSLEEWMITALRLLGVEAVRRAGRVGLWVPRPDGEADDKIAAIGVRIRRWVTFHGISLNVNPDLTHYAGIVPCGIRAHGVTSLQALGKSAPLETVDAALKTAWLSVFGS